MARYFFHTEDGRSVLDKEGMEFGSPTEAKTEAVRMMGEVLKDVSTEFWDTQALKLIVTDEQGLILFGLDLSAIEAPALSASRRR